jgi:hypothetical protein
LPAAPRFTGSPGVVAVPVVKLHTCFAARSMPVALRAPVVIVAVNNSLLARWTDGQNTAVALA